MDKIIILILTAVIGYWAERTPKQYSQSSLTFIPYSNTYPFYALWNPGGNVGRPFSPHRSLSSSAGPSGGISNHISSIPNNRHQFNNNNNPVARAVPYNNGQNAAQTPFVVPFASVVEAYDNIWNYDVNSLRARKIYPQNNRVANNRRIDNLMTSWNLPLKSYDEIQSDAGHTGFQRGSVESSFLHQKASPMQIFFPNYNQAGFTRSNIESRPEIRNYGATVGLRSADIVPISYKTGFSRGAVESSNYFPQSSSRIIRYDSVDNPVPSHKVVCYLASWSARRKDKGSFTPVNSKINAY
jgi:hypothetical protein